MQPTDLLASKPTLRRLSTLPKEGFGTLYAKDLPDATIQPFRAWHPPRLKTG